MKKMIRAAALPLAMTMILCAFGGGMAYASDADSASVTDTPQEVATVPEVTADAAENTTVETEEVHVTLPEDNGLAGVYKWIEMEKIGITANLIICDDGVGIFDMLGVVEFVKYDDTTMQTSGEGALPQSYTYSDGTLIWTPAGADEKETSTFVKLTAEELAAYEARGIGKAE